MPVSGAMDILSIELANLLVGNEPDETIHFRETTIDRTRQLYTARRMVLSGL